MMISIYAEGQDHPVKSVEVTAVYLRQLVEGEQE